MPDAWTRPVAPAVEPLPPARTPCTDLGAASGESALGDIPDDPEDRPPQRNDDEVQDLQQCLIAHCEELGDRVALLEPPRNTPTPADAVTWRGPLGSAHAALYHPWLRVRDPLDPDGHLASIPPAAAAAGVCARVDALIGVHAPPANQVVEGVLDVVGTVDDLDHGTLNDADVNVIRVQPGRGIRLLGARTVARDGEWRYLNVRRLLLAVEASIRQAARTAVFEPNGPALWKDVERGARGVLDQAWQRGMLAGATAAQAYDVRCDATTNPPEETAAGRLICLVGVQPPYPAEFVVVRVVQEVSSA
jgi:phage tail sheath protein FI